MRFRSGLMATASLLVAWTPLAAQKADPTPPATQVRTTASLGAGASTSTSQDQGTDRSSADRTPVQATVADPASEDIVVTGSRLREESVQRTPIAVSVVDQRTISDLHAPDVRALSSLVPNLQISTNPTANGTPLIFLRGFGVVGTEVAIEPGVALYIDGVYQPTQSGGLAELFDIERVEVLRGPQSTLLGKNASAGALLLRRIRPQNEFSGRVQAEYGSFNLRQVQGLINIPIIDGVLASKFYGYYRKRDGYIDAQVPGVRDSGAEDTYTLRGALLFTPTPDLSVYLTADYSRRHPSQTVGRIVTPATGVPCAVFRYCQTGVGRRNVAFNGYDERPLSRDRNVTMDTEYGLDGAKLTSITGYRKFHQNNDADLDGTPLVLFDVHNQIFDIESISQEFRLTSEKNGGLDLNGRLAWLIAGYFNHSDSFQTQPQRVYNGTTIQPAPISNQASQTLRTSYAVFGHVDFDVTDQITVSGGARKAWDKTEHNFALRVPGAATPPLIYGQQRKDGNFSIDAGAQYKFDATKMAYFRYAEGYRGGGFVGLVGSLAQSVGGYGPETSKAYELGVKTEFFDRRLLFNVALYTTKFDDLQRTQTEPNGANGFVIVTRNVAKARTRGFEIEAVMKPLDGLQVRSSIGYLDAKYLDYVSGGVDLSNTPFQYAPKWTYNVQPSYEFAFGSKGVGIVDTARAQVNVDYGSKRLVSSIADPLFIQAAYPTVDFQLSLTGGKASRYTLNAYVQNIGDRNYLIYGTRVSTISTLLFDNPGRTAGVSLELKF